MSDEATPTLRQRLTAIASEMQVGKGGEAPSQIGGFKFTRIDDVETALIPLLVKHGVSAIPTMVSQETEQHGKQWVTKMVVSVEFARTDHSELTISVVGSGLGIDSQDKGMGKAWAYALKNVYMAVFHLRGGEDRDVEAHAVDEPEPELKPLPVDAPKVELPPVGGNISAQAVHHVQAAILSGGDAVDGDAARRIAKHAEAAGWENTDSMAVLAAFGLGSLAEVPAGAAALVEAMFSKFPPADGRPKATNDDIDALVRISRKMDDFER